MAKPNVLIRTKKNKAVELLNANRLHEADAVLPCIEATWLHDYEA